MEEIKDYIIAPLETSDKKHILYPLTVVDAIVTENGKDFGSVVTSATQAAATANAAVAQAQQVAQSIANKVDKSYVDTELAKKQDTITDGSIAKVKLASDVQNSLGKADSAVQPSAISDMETKTHAAASYQPKGSYLTAQDISGKADKTYVDTELAKKQATLVKGDNITLATQSDGTVKVSADGGTAAKTTYDHTSSGLNATNVQTAIDELHTYDEVIEEKESATYIPTSTLVNVLTYDSQSLNASQKTQARSNIGAASASELGDLALEVGTLSDLETTAKNDLVSAINEVKQSGGSGASVREDLDAIKANMDNFGDVHCKSIDSDEIPMVCHYPMIVYGTTAPTITPDFIGQMYIDKTNGKVYVSTGVANASSFKVLN